MQSKFTDQLPRGHQTVARYTGHAETALPTCGVRVALIFIAHVNNEPDAPFRMCIEVRLRVEGLNDPIDQRVVDCVDEMKATSIILNPHRWWFFHPGAMFSFVKKRLIINVRKHVPQLRDHNVG